MGHIRYASDVGAPVEVAFTYTDNHLFVPDWMFGIAAFEPVGEAGHGPGAVYAATFRLGLWHPTVDCEITEYRRNAVIGYTLRRRRPGKVAPAQDQEARPALATLTLRFDPLGYGRSVLTSEADYPPARGWPAAKVIDALAQAAVRRSESQLRREIEEFHGTDLVGRIA
ncbi:SRPBCC family protein [Nocardia africana]|uniref:Polyketide cyclase / dehydrase and lipid transport n=1 Tax=Nocardia africana TaxID=134964 RepID=A0A378WKH0_9NOCA|nr:SRPBCC family protein [Nocardia africana]MCC3318184.1 SRPBCC family protein [Nocardia africana]SUA40914.1 Polyketide cyclase / dehydrase and lipid transport [Nocardia africana]